MQELPKKSQLSRKTPNEEIKLALDPLDIFSSFLHITHPHDLLTTFAKSKHTGLRVILAMIAPSALVLSRNYIFCGDDNFKVCTRVALRKLENVSAVSAILCQILSQRTLNL